MDTNESKIYIALLSGAVTYLILVIFFVIKIIRFHRHKIAFEDKKLKAQFNYLDSIRERIGIDLHDDLGPSLSLLKMKLGQLKTGDTKAKEIVDFCKNHLDKVLLQVKEISVSMIPRTLQRQGVNHALKELVNSMSDSTGITVKFKYNAGVINNEKGIQIYRMTQEILNNIVKHSGADQVEIHLRQTDQVVTLSIHDDRRGCDSQVIASGMGMNSMRERAESVGASLRITSLPGRGTQIVLERAQSPHPYIVFRLAAVVTFC